MGRHIRIGHVAPADFHAAAIGIAQADKRLNELVLTIACNACDSDNLAAPHGQAHMVDHMLAGRRRDREVDGFEKRIARRQRTLLYLKIDVAAGHRPHDLARVGVGGAQVRDGAAVTQDRDPVRDSRHFVELVGHEQDSASLGCKVFQHGEQRVALGRRQDRGRLVKNENARVAVERLEDLDPLAHSDGQIADPGVRVDREMVMLRELGDTIARGAAVDERAAPRLRAIDDVFPGRQRAEQLERLMHHAQARRHRVDRRTEARQARHARESRPHPAPAGRTGCS